MVAAGEELMDRRVAAVELNRKKGRTSTNRWIDYDDREANGERLERRLGYNENIL